MEGGQPPERGEAFAGFLWFDAPPADLQGPFPPLQLDLLQPVAGGGGALPLPPLPADPLLLPVAGLGGGSGDLQLPLALQQVAAEAPAARGGRRRASEEERRARNRATQQRFRERQKAKNDALVQEHATTAAQLELTRSEHEELQAQNAVLQKLLNVRDSTLAVLGSAAGPGGAQQAQQQQAQAQQAQQQQASGGSPSSSLDREASGGEIAGAASMTSNVARHMQRLQVELSAHLAQQLELPATAHPDEAMAVAVAKMPPPSPCKSPPGEPELALALTTLGQGCGAAAAACAVDAAAGGSAAAACAAAAGGSTSAGAAAAGEEEMEEVVPEQQPQQGGHGGGEACDIATLVQQRPDLLQRAMAMGPADQIADWHVSARTFREILESHEATRSTAELEQIVAILRERSMLFSITLHFKPENAQALFATAADAPQELWPAVARSLAPTQAQRAMLQQAWGSFVSRVAAIRAKRVAAVQAVRDAAQTTQAAAAVTPDSLPATTLGGMMSQYLSLFDAAGHLSSLRDAEFIAMLQLMGRTGAVFSPVQKARVAAASFPYFPDVVQLVRILAEEGQHPPAAAASQDSGSSASVGGGGDAGSSSGGAPAQAPA